MSVLPDEWRAFNDYDLVVVADGHVDITVLPPLAADLARRLDVDFVDIGVIQHAILLSRPLDTVYAYELKAGHRVLSGPVDVLDRMPSINPAMLPPIEATRLLVNRGWGLVWARLHLEEALADGTSFDAHRRRFTVNAIHKGVLAIGEAALLLAGQYDLSYRERARRLTKLDLAGALADQAELFREAFAGSTRFKLSPVVPEDDAGRLVEWWIRVRNWHESMLGHVEALRLGRRYDDWSRWRRAIGWEGLRSLLRRPRRFLAERATGEGLGPLRLDRDHEFRRRLPALLYGFGRERLGDDWRASARLHLKAWHP